MSTNSRKDRASARLSHAGTLAASVLAILATAADAQAVTQWDLPGQPLAKSLRAIAAQSESNIIFDRKLVNDQLAAPLKTTASAEQALSQVLEGTGLTYRHLDDKTVTIQLASTDPLATTSGAYRMQGGRIRLAQATMEPAEGQQRPGRTIEGRPLIEIEEIIVTGTNIRGIQNNTAPLTVLSKEYIDATGFGTTSKLIESLPQNFALTNQSGVNLQGVSTSRNQGSSINLRGIGEGTTLVLLNGRRIAPGYRSAAVDISALPLSAIEQVEILTDGASALYGSDAVGGVVNFILRDDFEGAQTRVRAGWADGINEYRVSQALGNTWNSGSALLSVEYYKRDLLLARDRDFIPSAITIGSLLPEDENYAAVFSGQQDLSPTVRVFADMLYTQRDSFNIGGQLANNEDAETDNPQATATAGVNWKVGGDWQLELAGTYSRNKLEQELGGLFPSFYDADFETTGALLKGDGSIFQIPGGNVRAAVGVEWREESYEEVTRAQATGVVSASVDSDQRVSSAFAEVYVPLFSPENALPGLHALELSIAGRYDEYSEVPSSFDPQVGLMWEPVSGVRLRASHGTSYKAPNLLDRSFADNRATALFVPGTTTYLLQSNGIDVDSLSPQESKSSSFGLEFIPEAAKGLVVGINYYRIEYTDRIANPPTNALVLLNNPAAFGDLIIQDPSIDQVNEYIRLARLGRGFSALNAMNRPDPNFDPARVDVIVDLRRRNLSVVNTEGLDLALQYDVGIGASRLNFGISGTYILDLETQVTDTSAEVDVVDTIYNPPHWRARATIGWQLAGWTTNLFVNHTDSYNDNRFAVPQPVDSYTTLDARVAYDFSSRFDAGWLSGLQISASVQNMLDEDPPRIGFFSPTTDLGFDSTNASALGRFIALELTKSW